MEQALRDVTLQDAKIESSRSDKEKRKFVEAHVVVKDSRFEIPVPLKTGVVAIPDNMAVAKNRLENLKKKALKDTDLREFLTECFCELQELNYIERVMFETPVWYFPYFVASQAKKRIVYDGKAAFKGVCINDFIETGPDLLNPLADILARFQLGKFAMMADLTKCFFQIGVPAEQCDLFHILWFDKNDVREGNVVTYRFTRHPWGVKSSPFIASFSIQKTLDDNTTCTSDLTLDAIRKNIYMDDLMFSVDSLDEAKIIANEAIDLFDSRGFKLVKWSANKNAVPVLAKFEKEVLISGMRELDLSIEHDNDLFETKALGYVWETGGIFENC